MKLTTALLFIVLSLIHLCCCIFDKQKLRMITKPFLMPLLSFCWINFSEDYSVPVLMGILFGGLGDFALLWPLKRIPFLLGEIFFLLGHIFYLLYIFTAYEIHAGIILPLVVAAVYLCGSGFTYIKTRPEIPLSLRPTSFLYMLALSSLSACSLLVLISSPGTGTALAFAGASLFLISDGILSQMLFILKKETGKLNFVVMLTYLAAQVLLTLGWVLG